VSGGLSGIQAAPPVPPDPPEPPDPLEPPVPLPATHSGPSPRILQMVPSMHVMSVVHCRLPSSFFSHIKISSPASEQILALSTGHASPAPALPLHPTATTRGERKSAETNALYTWYFITTSLQRSTEVPTSGDPYELFCNPRATRKSKGFSGRSSYTGAIFAPCHHDALNLREILAPVLRDSGKYYAAGFTLSANRTPEWRRATTRPACPKPCSKL
jgi:hypothetical protein